MITHNHVKAYYWLIVLIILTLFPFYNSIDGENLSYGTSIPLNTPLSEKPIQMLIINSYDRDNVWTRSIEETFIQTLTDSNVDVRYYFEYLSAKKFTGDAYLESLSTLFRSKYQQADIQYILTTDDDATVFISKNVKAIFGREIPVVYCAVNNRYDFPSFMSGIFENSEVIETVSLIRNIQGNNAKVLIITDQTTSSNSIVKLNDLHRADQNDVDLELLQSNEVNLIKERIAKEDYDAVIFLLFNKDNFGNDYSYVQGFELFKEGIHVPVYSTWDFYLGRGLLGGKIADSKVQGRQAALQMLKVMGRGTVTSQIITVDNQYIFDDAQLKKFGILESQLPNRTLVINKKESYFEKNKEIILVFLCIVLILLVIIFMMKRLIKRQVNQLQTANEKLNDLRQLEFVLNIAISFSHELNTYIGNSITLNSLVERDIEHIKTGIEHESLKKSSAIDNLSEIQTAIGDIYENLRHATGFITKIKEGLSAKWHRQCLSFNPAEVFERVSNTYQAALSSHEIALNSQIKGTSNFTGDPSDLEDILSVLMDNAILHGFKAFRGNKTIDIEIHTDLEKMMIRFADNGVGIPSDKQPHIFDPLFKVEMTDIGEGLGLFKVKQIVQHFYNGQIICESTVMKGTLFHITLYKETEPKS